VAVLVAAPLGVVLLVLTVVFVSDIAAASPVLMVLEAVFAFDAALSEVGGLLVSIVGTVCGCCVSCVFVSTAGVDVAPSARATSASVENATKTTSTIAIARKYVIYVCCIPSQSALTEKRLIEGGSRAPCLQKN
jgi:hypothetical protein